MAPEPTARESAAPGTDPRRAEALAPFEASPETAPARTTLLTFIPRLPERPPPRHRLVVPICIFHAAVMLTWSLLRHHNFGSTSDLGAYHAVFWNLAWRGTAWNSIDRIHQWSTHVELGLLWLVLPYRFHTSPVWLFLTQSVSLAAAALPVEAVARRVTRDPIVGLLAAAAMLLTPQLLFAEVNDFHPIAICTLPMAVVAWGIETDRRRAIAVGAVVAISIREHMGLLLVAAAVAWVIRQGVRRLWSALALGIFGLSAFLAAVLWVIPSFGSGSLNDVVQYQRIGGSAADAVRTVAAHPLAFLTIPFEGDRKLFLLALASGGLPLLVLSLRSLRRSAWPLLLAAPLLIVQLLSDDPARWDIRSYYGVPIVPLVATACALALVFIPKGDLRPRLTYVRLAAAAWLVLVIGHMARVMPSPVGPGRPIDRAFQGSPRDLALRRAFSLIPADASISAQDDVVPHVATREEVHLWPDGEATDDFTFLDLGGVARNVKSPEALEHAAERLRADRHVSVLLDEAGVLLIKRIGAENSAGKH